METKTKAKTKTKTKKWKTTSGLETFALILEALVLEFETPVPVQETAKSEKV